MARTFRASIYTPQDISHQGSALALWRLLSDSQIGPRRFGDTERPKIDFTADSYNRASEIYGTEGMLFVSGSSDNFLAMFMRQRDGWGIWNFWWDAKVMTTQKRDHWLEWLFKLCRELPPFYALGCSTAEYDAKHTIVEAVPDGSVTRTVGASAANFYEYLPGMYWLSIFGPQLAAHFDARLLSLEHTQAVTLNSAGIAVILDEPVIPHDMDERLQTEAGLTRSLGSQYFFDRTLTGVDYQAVPALAQALRNLKAEGTN